MGKESKEILRILSKTPSKRTHLEIVQLSSFLREEKFFASMSDELSNEQLYECCTLIKYELKPADSYVVHYREKATRFYIILKGLVGILAPTYEEGKTKMVEVLEMRDGASFGELGLNENKPRAASVYCKEPTHLLFLEKDHYLELFVNHIRNKQTSVVETLKQTYMFSSFSNIFLVKLSYLFNEEKVSRGTALFREGQAVEKIYIIKQGEFRISKKIERAGPLLKRNSIFKKHVKEDAELALLAKGSFCNEEDLLNDKHGLTCTCTSLSGAVLSINKNDLVHKILNKEAEYTMSSLKHKQNMRDYQTKSASKSRNIWDSSTPATSYQPDTLLRQIPRIRTSRNVPSKKPNSPFFLQKSTKSIQLLKYYREESSEKIGYSIENNSANSVSKRIYNWVVLGNPCRERVVSKFTITGSIHS